MTHAIRFPSDPRKFNFVLKIAMLCFYSNISVMNDTELVHNSQVANNAKLVQRI